MPTEEFGERTTDKFCERAWHDGKAVVADYYLKGVDINGSSYETNRFACCRTHLETATHIMLMNNHHIEVALA